MFKLPVFGSRGNGNGNGDGHVQSHAKGHVGERPPQPFSRADAARKTPRIDGATVTESVCPYCAVGCGQHIYTKGGQIIDIEGNPHSPINEGTLCPKGANVFQLAKNPHRVKNVMYRAPYATDWEKNPWNGRWSGSRRSVYDARERGWSADRRRARTLNAVRNFGTLGGATLDNEENYLIKKLFTAGLGVLSVENQARI